MTPFPALRRLMLIYHTRINILALDAYQLGQIVIAITAAP